MQTLRLGSFTVHVGVLCVVVETTLSQKRSEMGFENVACGCCVELAW